MLDTLLGLEPNNTAQKSNSIFDFSDPQKAAAWKMISNGTTPSVGAPRPMFQGVGDAYSQAQTAQARQQDMQLKNQEKMQQEQSKNQTRQWLIDNNHHDLVQGFDTGAMSMTDAFSAGMKRTQEAREAEKAKAEREQQIEYLRSKGISEDQLGAISAGVTGVKDVYKSSQQEAPKPTSLMKEYDLAVQQGFQGDIIAYQQARKGQGITYTSPDGTTFQIGGGAKAPAMKEAQAKANIYASRMENSNKILEQLENEGTSLWNKIASNVPLGNYALDPEYRQYDQAKRDFINATLRQESGAVIADTEFANGERQYFPQPGDDPKTIAQKKENRRIAMEAIRQASGQPTTNPTFGEEDNLDTNNLDIDALLDQYAD